jgi:hypothetical protein
MFEQMAMVNLKVLICDCDEVGIASICHEEIQADSVSAVKKKAKEMGWTTIDGYDLCRVHTKRYEETQKSAS